MDANIFFHNATFQESVERSEPSKLVITNALEEFLLNCSAKVLKSDKDLLVFEQMQVFTDAILSGMNNGIKQDLLILVRKRKNKLKKTKRHKNSFLQENSNIKKLSRQKEMSQTNISIKQENI